MYIYTESVLYTSLLILLRLLLLLLDFLLRRLLRNTLWRRSTLGSRRASLLQLVLEHRLHRQDHARVTETGIHIVRLHICFLVAETTVGLHLFSLSFSNGDGKIVGVTASLTHAIVLLQSSLRVRLAALARTDAGLGTSRFLCISSFLECLVASKAPTRTVLRQCLFLELVVATLATTVILRIVHGTLLGRLARRWIRHRLLREFLSHLLKLRIRL